MATNKGGRPLGSKDKQPRGRIRRERSGHPWCEWLDAKEMGLLRYGVSAQLIRIWAQEGKLPQPYQLGENTVRWKRSELDEWDAERKPIRYKHGAA